VKYSAGQSSGVQEAAVDSLNEELEAIAALLPRLIGAQQRQLTHDLAGYGLTFPQFITLTALEQLEGECRMGPLASAAMQSAASMTGIVDRLLERGLVERDRHAEDRRAVIVRLTAKGRDLLDQAQESRLQQGRLLLASLPAADRRHMREVLARIVDYMEKNASD
jgi:DNA-binding MarR family transcriptional regulator